MWKPAEVVDEHRWRARVIWASLLLAITGYTMWQAWSMYDGFSNPITSLEVTHETYEFPYILVCFFEGYGCGWSDGTVDQCVADALTSSAVYDRNYEEVEGLIVESMWDNCMGFDLPRLNIVDEGLAPDEAHLTIYMHWRATDIASTEVAYTNMISIYMSDSEPTEDDLAWLDVPYTRYVPNNETILPVGITALNIGETTEENLDGEVTTTFPALIMSTATLAMENTEEPPLDDTAYGVLHLDLAQGAFSRTSVKELSPLDLGGFFGNIGGFWELLIVLWGLFFITTRKEDAPKLKAREFIQPVKEIIRRRGMSVDSGASAANGEERPHWESAFQGTNPTSDAPTLPPRGGVTMAGGTAAAAGFPGSS